MTVLLTGATGTVGSLVLRELQQRHTGPIRALTRTPDTASFPDGVQAVAGDLLDVDAMRAAMDGVDTLFLLSAVTAEELTATLLTLNLARELPVKGIVYLSVYQAKDAVEVPHFAAKHAAGRMVQELDLPATILRPTLFAQNDTALQQALLQGGVYPTPIGNVGVSMVDVRDIAEVAALELTRRADAADPQPREAYDLLGPDALTGPDVAAIWSDLLNRPIRYTGDDLTAYTAQMRTFAPAWMADDIRHMSLRFQQSGARATSDGLTRLTARLGHPPRPYRDLAAELTHHWTTQPTTQEISGHPVNLQTPHTEDAVA